MILVQGRNISRHFGPQILYTDIQFQIDEGQRVGLIGRNGIGKTTLLRMILGEDMPDEGTLSLQRGIRVGYLSQHMRVDPSRTVRAEVETAFADLHALEKRMEELQNIMAESGEADPKVVDEYHEAQVAFEQRGGYIVETRLGKVLVGLGVPEHLWDGPVSHLSGGQKNRVAMAKLILSSPDLLLLDEPTNFLDLPATEWLESYLVTEKPTLLVVSHDRYFLDNVATHIWELEREQLLTYAGNYKSSREQKQLLLESHQREFDKQQNFIRKEKEFIRRHMGSQRTAEARGRRTRLQRLERIDAWTEEDASLRLKIQPARRGANIILECENLAVGYENKSLTRGITFEIHRGDKVGIVGANGTGKTTLLRTLMQKIPPVAGKSKWGANLDVAYYEQELQGLHPERSVLQEVVDEAEGFSIEQVRSFLGRFRFSGDDQDKLIGTLSGGEKARVILSRLLLRRPNVLVMDEPTNHLDIAARESLEIALQDFGGTLVVVSHDRRFLDAFVTKLLVLENGAAKLYPGNYMDHKNRLAAASAAPPVPTPQAQSQSQSKARPQSKKDSKASQNRIKQLQREGERLQVEIQALEGQLDYVHEQLALPDNYSNPAKVKDLDTKLKRLQEDIATLYERWENSEKEIETLRGDNGNV